VTPANGLVLSFLGLPADSAFSALTLLAGHQEEHPAAKIE